MRSIKTFIQNGFHITPAVAAFVMRGSISAAVATAICMALGFHEFYWAGVTAWIMAMPSRGQVFVKAGYRCAGTLAGAAFAFLIIPLAQNPALYLGALCLWVAVCAFTACSLRRFRSYMAQLAGYTATIIGGFVLITPHVDHHWLATERLAMVFIGIMISAVVTILFAPSADLSGKELQLEGLVSQAINRAIELLGKNEQAFGPQDWTAIAEFESDYAFAAIESRKARMKLRKVRQALAGISSFLAAVRAFTALMGPEHCKLAGALNATLTQLNEGQRDAESVRIATGRLRLLAQSILAAHPSLHDRAAAAKLVDVSSALAQMAGCGESSEDISEQPIFAISQLHPDRSRSVSVAVRTVTAMSAMGALWMQVGEGEGWIFAFVMTSVACCLFGTFPGSHKALKGFAAAVGAAVASYVLFAICNAAFGFGSSANLWVVTAGCMVGAIPLANGYRRAMDYNTNFTVLMLGVTPQAVPLTTSMTAGLAMVVGILVSICVFRVPFRSETARFESFQARIAGNLCRIGRHGGIKESVWESYMYDVMVQVSLSEFSRERRKVLFALCQQTLDWGTEVISIERKRNAAGLDVEQRALLDKAMANIRERAFDAERTEFLDLAAALANAQRRADGNSETEVQHIAASLAYLGFSWRSSGWLAASSNLSAVRR